MTLDEQYEVLRTRKDLQIEIATLETQRATFAKQIADIDVKIAAATKRIAEQEAKLAK